MKVFKEKVFKEKVFKEKHFTMVFRVTQGEGRPLATTGRHPSTAP
jgi:hypothetical protein